MKHSISFGLTCCVSQKGDRLKHQLVRCGRRMGSILCICHMSSTSVATTYFNLNWVSSWCFVLHFMVWHYAILITLLWYYCYSFCYRKLTLAESNIVSVSRQQNSDGLGTLLPPSEPARVPTSFERNRWQRRELHNAHRKQTWVACSLSHPLFPSCRIWNAHWCRHCCTWRRPAIFVPARNQLLGLWTNLFLVWTLCESV